MYDCFHIGSMICFSLSSRTSREHPTCLGGLKTEVIGGQVAFGTPIHCQSTQWSKAWFSPSMVVSVMLNLPAGIVSRTRDQFAYLFKTAVVHIIASYECRSSSSCRLTCIKISFFFTHIYIWFSSPFLNEFHLLIVDSERSK